MGDGKKGGKGPNIHDGGGACGGGDSDGPLNLVQCVHHEAAEHPSSGAEALPEVPVPLVHAKGKANRKVDGDKGHPLLGGDQDRV